MPRPQTKGETMKKKANPNAAIQKALDTMQAAQLKREDDPRLQQGDVEYGGHVGIPLTALPTPGQQILEGIRFRNPADKPRLIDAINQTITHERFREDFGVKAEVRRLETIIEKLEAAFVNEQRRHAEDIFKLAGSSNV